MASIIVVIGGGFAGVKCAKTLRKNLGKDEFEIILFASENHMVFHPLLAEVASSSINPKHMAAPLRELLKDVHIRMEEVSNVDLEQNEIWYESFEAGKRKLSYDQLVIACGNTSNLAVVPGMADHAFPMKTVGDALALQLQIINQMERAEICNDPELRKHILTFIVVGGGFSGVEIAGEIYDFMTKSAEYYSNFSRSDIKVILIHSHDQILPEVSPSLREFARREMEKQGIEFYLNAKASFCTGKGVGLKDGKFIEGATVICTIGTRPSPIVDNLAVPKENGRILVNSDMSIFNYKNAWAIGDCAAVPNAPDGVLSPGTGQFAERQGAQVGHNLIARIKGNPTKPFQHKSLGVLCSIGGKNAVAETMGFKFSGFFAWMMWRGTYLFKLPSVAQQVGVGLTWFFGLLFPPALTGLRTDQSGKIGSAYHKAGDWIFRKDEPATEFYAIKEGEVEIINHADGKEYVLAVLGKGDFFGESALMDNRLRRNSCRAKTDLELLVLGKSVFEQLSTILAPLQSALADAIKRRQFSLDDTAEAKQVLNQLKLSAMLEPISSEKIEQTATLQTAVQKMKNGKLDVLYVVDDHQRLEGLVTRTDLMRALEIGIHLRPQERRALPVKAFMTPSPMCVTQSDDAAAAVLTMREHGFKRMPVVDDCQSKVLLGYVRIENIIGTAMDKLLEMETASSRDTSK
jgi:NADH dehydrogenase